MSLLGPRVGISALALLVAAPCLAQINLVTNGNFDKDVSKWEPVEDFMSIGFDFEDADGSEESGSARVTFNPAIGFETKGHVAQCVEVLPGRAYAGSASVLIPTGQDRQGTAGLRVAWYESGDCSGISPEFAFGISSNREGQWIDLPFVDFVAPNDILSAEVQLEITKPVLGGALSVLYDNVIFVPEPASLLSGTMALVCLIGLASLKRQTGIAR